MSSPCLQCTKTINWQKTPNAKFSLQSLGQSGRCLCLVELTLSQLVQEQVYGTEYWYGGPPPAVRVAGVLWPVHARRGSKCKTESDAKTAQGHRLAKVKSRSYAHRPDGRWLEGERL